MSKVVTLVLVLIGAVLLVVGIAQGRTNSTSEGAGSAAALITVGLVVLVGAAAGLVVLRRRRRV